MMQEDCAVLSGNHGKDLCDDFYNLEYFFSLSIGISNISNFLFQP